MGEAKSRVIYMPILVSDRYEKFDELIDDFSESLGRQVEREVLSSEQLRNDEMIELPDNMDAGEDFLEGTNRYRLEDEEKAVYIFDHNSGKLIIGDESMIAVAMPEYVPEDLYTGLDTDLSQEQWSASEL